MFRHISCAQSTVSICRNKIAVGKSKRGNVFLESVNCLELFHSATDLENFRQFDPISKALEIKNGQILFKNNDIIYK